MKYTITENRLQELVNNYFNSFRYDIDDLGGDIVVWNAESGMRMFDTYGDNLLIESGLLNSIESLFGYENVGKYILNWFNNYFETNLDDFGDINHDDDEDEEDILSYKLQISAYMFMCAEKYNEVPKLGRIRIANEQTSEIQTFIVHDYELKDYLGQFIDLAKKFREIHGI